MTVYRPINFFLFLFWFAFVFIIYGVIGWFIYMAIVLDLWMPWILLFGLFLFVGVGQSLVEMATKIEIRENITVE